MVFSASARDCGLHNFPYRMKGAQMHGRALHFHNHALIPQSERQVHSVSLPGISYIALPCQLSQCVGMKRHAPLRGANDNGRNSPPMPSHQWDVYGAAVTARWLGRIVAGSVDAAVEAAAIEFNADARKLIAAGRRERA
jgi:hypothetical protein